MAPGEVTTALQLAALCGEAVAAEGILRSMEAAAQAGPSREPDSGTASATSAAGHGTCCNLSAGART